MEKTTTSSEQKKILPEDPSWIPYLMLVIIIICIFKMCSYYNEVSDKEEPSYKKEEVSTIKLRTDIKYRFLKERRSYGKENTQLEDYLYRSYAYEITDFDKNNPKCWRDLYDLGESLSTKTDKNAKLMTTMVYFFLPSDSLRLQDQYSWDLTWDESQDSLWIGNYLWLSGNGHKELIRGVNYR